MFFKWLKGKNRKQDHDNSEIKSPLGSSVQQVEYFIKERMQNSVDLVSQYIKKFNNKVAVFYISDLTSAESLNSKIVQPLVNLNNTAIDIESIADSIAVANIKYTRDLNEILFHLVRGWVYLHVDGQPKGLLINVTQKKERSINRPENETNVYGPQLAFTEALETNIGIIRQFIASPMLAVDDVLVGKVSQNRVAIFYIKGLVNEQNLNTLKQRVNEVEFDGLIDTSQLAQLISDNTLSIFPQMRMTERPDYVGNSLIEGKIAVIVDGSPYAIIAPSTFINFFQSSEDHYMLWSMGTFIRLVRFTAMFLSVFFTAMYVAALTFHYEIIPSALLIPLGQTRAKVPFPPLLEAIFLEFTIELLREAGARLPTKVGQTIGIVGGIVIGQAAVQAGFTSNILIIIVALSALASFTAPSYEIGTAIRIIRFPMIILAGIWGGIGIMFGALFIVLHMLRLSSLGNPYLSPFYPLRIKDLRDSIVRLPYSLFNSRPIYSRAGDKGRFDRKRSRITKDIDE